MCLERLGKLEIPNGLAGAAGPAGANGAGWASGAGDPVGAPAADIIFWLNTTSGELFKYVSGSWVSQVASIFGTDGNLWLTGAVAPTAPTAEGNFYYNTATGDIYQYLSGSWGAPISNIKGANGTNGTNGSDGASLLAASGVSAPLTTRNVWASLYSATVSGSQLCPATSDVAKVCVKFTGYQTNSTVGLGISSALKLRFKVNGVPISNSGTNYSELLANVDVNGVYKTYIDAELLIVRTSSSAAKYIAKCLNGDSLNSRVISFENDDPGVTINFSTNVTISVEAQMFTASVGTVFAQGSSFYIETLRQ